MVGDFSTIIRKKYDPDLYDIALKPEYIGVGEISSLAGQVLVIFNTETTDKEMYPYYYQNGLDDIFDLVPKF